MAYNLLIAALVLTFAPVSSRYVPEADMHGPALSLLQGHAAKVIKRRSGSATTGSSSTEVARGAATRAAVAALVEDDFSGLGGLSLIQEKQAKIKGSAWVCGVGIEAALLAAAQDGVEDGLAALSLLQGYGAKLKGDECREAAGAPESTAASADMAAADAAADGTVSLLQEHVKVLMRGVEVVKFDTVWEK